MRFNQQPRDARAFIDSADFRWHQRFLLADGVYTPGESDVERLLAIAEVPSDLSGMSVLDIGTSNGGACFEAERRGAERVVGVDIAEASHSGFAQVRGFLGSRAEYVQASIYEARSLLAEQFDLVLCWGVLYHLRHPLLALDELRELTRGHAVIETAVADHELGRFRKRPLVRFYRGAELHENPSNWFAPTVAALLDWCASSGLRPTHVATWPPTKRELARYALAHRSLGWTPRLAPAGSQTFATAERCMVRVEPSAEPEFREVSWAEALQPAPAASCMRLT